jgi:O-acetylserine/cysteine efflux transporter
MAPVHVVLVVLVTLSWGVNFLASKVAVDHFGPYLSLALRFALVVLVLAPFLRIPRARIPVAAGIGLMIGGVHFGLQFLGIELSGDVSSIAITSQLYIPMATVLAVVLLGERIGWRRSFALTTAFGGVVVLGFDPVVFDRLWALLALVLSAVPMAAATLMMRRAAGVGALQIQAWTGVVCLPVHAFLSLLLESGQVAALASLPLWPTIGLLWGVFAAAIVGQGGYAHLLAHYPVSLVSPLMLATPLVGVAAGVIAFGDALSAQVFVGGGMVSGGILFLMLRTAKRAVERAPAR